MARIQFEILRGDSENAQLLPPYTKVHGRIETSPVLNVGWTPTRPVGIRSEKGCFVSQTHTFIDGAEPSKTFPLPFVEGYLGHSG